MSWHALRFWTELGFKAIKSLGWRWHKTRRTDPARISRHWLVLSVATPLALAYGTRVEDANDRKLAPSNLRAPQDTVSPERLPPPPAGKDRQRNPVRRRLAAAVAVPGSALASSWAAAGTLA